MCFCSKKKKKKKKKRPTVNTRRRHHLTGRTLNSWVAFFTRPLPAAANRQKEPYEPRSTHSSATRPVGDLTTAASLDNKSPHPCYRSQFNARLSCVLHVAGAHGVRVEKVGKVFCGQEIIQLMLASRSQPRIDPVWTWEGRSSPLLPTPLTRLTDTVSSLYNGPHIRQTVELLL